MYDQPADIIFELRWRPVSKTWTVTGLALIEGEYDRVYCATADSTVGVGLDEVRLLVLKLVRELQELLPW